MSFNCKGEMQVVHKAHGMGRAADYMARSLADQGQEQGALIYFTLHTRAEKSVERLANAIGGEHGAVSWCGGCATHRSLHRHACGGQGAIGVMSYPASLHSPTLRSEEMFLSL